MNPQTEQFTALMGKYKLSHPVSPEDQRYIIGSVRTSLAELLKKKGSYGAAVGIIVTIQIILKKAGIKLSLLQTKIMAGLTAAAMSSATVAGTYTTVIHVKKKLDESKKTAEKAGLPGLTYEKNHHGMPDLSTNDQIKSYYNKIEEIYLDDGSRLVGAVIFQDRNSIKIHTVHGVIQLPVSGIRTIKLR